MNSEQCENRIRTTDLAIVPDFRTDQWESSPTIKRCMLKRGHKGNHKGRNIKITFHEVEWGKEDKVQQLGKDEIRKAIDGMLERISKNKGKRP